MAMDGLAEGVSPAGSVPEQLLQAAPILEWRRRQNREVFAKKGSVLGVSTPRGKYRRWGASRGPTVGVRGKKQKISALRKPNPRSNLGRCSQGEDRSSYLLQLFNRCTLAAEDLMESCEACR